MHASMMEENKTSSIGSWQKKNKNAADYRDIRERKWNLQVFHDFLPETSHLQLMVNQPVGFSKGAEIRSPNGRSVIHFPVPPRC